MFNISKNKDSKQLIRTKNEVSTNDSFARQSFGSKILGFLQEIGKALQFPIAVLPFAAVLNRLGALGVSLAQHGDKTITSSAGYWISTIIQVPGAVVFDNLALLFAIGLAFGLSKDKRGEAAIVGGVFFFALNALTGVESTSLGRMFYKNVLTFTEQVRKDDGTVINGVNFSKLLYIKSVTESGPQAGGVFVLSIGALGGIFSGAMSAYLYDKFSDVKLPTALSFFGGRRFVPMIAMLVVIPSALLFAIVWPWIQFALSELGNAVAKPSNPAVAIPGTMLYGVLNRLLLPFGLHQILNTIFWFQLPIKGDTIDPISGNIRPDSDPNGWTNGDIAAFTDGREDSGLFQSGFFPVMMGGIPAIAIAMIFCAKKENRQQVAGFLGGVAAVSLISGITEPIEFSFVFIAPVLLGVHSLLTGLFVGIVTAMHIQLGFGFSAGLIDYIISFAQSWGLSQHAGHSIYAITGNPLWILPLSALCFVAYFFVFSFLIKKMNILTPGREGLIETNSDDVKTEAKASGKKASSKEGKNDKYAEKARIIIEAVGADNITNVDNCATRLRLSVVDSDKIDDAKVKSAGAYGIKKLTKTSAQIVIGTDVEFVAKEVGKQLAKSVTK